MTLNKVFAKLRKYNKKNYYQLKFCITFAVMLIASFISMVLNPAIQNALPSGGDSRRMVYMILLWQLLGVLFSLSMLQDCFYGIAAGKSGFSWH